MNGAPFAKFGFQLDLSPEKFDAIVDIAQPKAPFNAMNVQADAIVIEQQIQLIFE